MICRRGSHGGVSQPSCWPAGFLDRWDEFVALWWKHELGEQEDRESPVIWAQYRGDDNRPLRSSLETDVSLDLIGFIQDSYPVCSSTLAISELAISGGNRARLPRLR